MSEIGVFADERPRLFGLAYRILGSVTDAEDVVQEAWIRWSAVDADEVVNAAAYLTTITTRLALNALRDRQAARETYVGPWLPEPLLIAQDFVEDDEPSANVEVADAVSLAMLIVLETLSPTERAVFVLREIFGYSYAEIAASVEKTESAVRQIAHRAREHVQARRPRADTNPAEHRQVTLQFLGAAAGGDMQGLLDLLAPDVRLVSDGGGKARAATRPIEGADKVARFYLGILRKVDLNDLQLQFVSINGKFGIAAWQDDQLIIAGLLDVVDGLVTNVYLFANPDKLQLHST